MLIGEQLSRTIQGSTVLRDADVSVEPGSITVCLGPNGAGKSVLLRALALIDPPSSGVVRIDDDIYTFPGTDPRVVPPWPRITLVFQQLFLWPHLTLRDNIMLAAENQGTEQDRLTDDLEALLERFDLSDVVARYPNEASGGQRQRVALIRAAILKPRWLLLDEPTSSQDLEQTQRFIEFCQDLRTAGVGLVIATHFLGLAAKLRAQILFLDNGRIVERGDASILAKPKSERLRRFVELSEYVSSTMVQRNASRPTQIEQAPDG